MSALKVTIETDTKDRMSINLTDDSGTGTGYRLAGRKYDGSGSPAIVAHIDLRAAEEIRRMLDVAFPAPSREETNE